MSEYKYDAIDTAVNLLHEAGHAVGGDKAYEHGDMMKLHQTIAELWNTYLTATNGTHVNVCPEDVATMMELLKIARRVHGSKKNDHYMDAAGYAAIAWAVSYKENKNVG
jgi:hypothetical protein